MRALLTSPLLLLLCFRGIGVESAASTAAADGTYCHPVDDAGCKTSFFDLAKWKWDSLGSKSSRLVTLNDLYADLPCKWQGFRGTDAVLRCHTVQFWLTEAAEHKDKASVKKIVNTYYSGALSGSTVDHFNDHGNTALQWAAVNGDTATSILLLNHGASRTRTAGGKNAVELARINGQEATASAIEAWVSPPTRQAFQFQPLRDLTRCPPSGDGPKCDDIGLKVGDLCEADGELGLNDELNNCGVYDYYVFSNLRVVEGRENYSKGHPNSSERRRYRNTVAAAPTNKGRLEIWHNNAWGTVCDDGFYGWEANLACQQLGYHHGKAYTAGASGNWAGPGNGQIWLDNVNCGGTWFQREQYRDIGSCPHQPWGTSNCGHHEDVGVRCGLEFKGEKTDDYSSDSDYSEEDGIDYSDERPTTGTPTMEPPSACVALNDDPRFSFGPTEADCRALGCVWKAPVRKRKQVVQKAVCSDIPPPPTTCDEANNAHSSTGPSRVYCENASPHGCVFTPPLVKRGRVVRVATCREPVGA